MDYKTWTDDFPASLPDYLFITFDAQWADECDFVGCKLYTRDEFLYEKRLVDLAISSYGLETPIPLYFGTNQEQEERLDTWLDSYRIYKLNNSLYLDNKFIIDILCTSSNKSYGAYKTIEDLLSNFEELFETENL